jgi:ATP-dependent DNA ligase
MVVVDGIDTARALMREVHARGGEGIILRPPNVGYVTGRSGFLKLTR